MKNFLRLGITGFFLLLLLNVQAQKKNISKQKPATKVEDVSTTPPPKNNPPGVELKKKDKSDIPPEIEHLEDTKIDVQTPEIDFDTTSVADDALTKSILRLLVATNSLENDVKAVEASLKENMASNNSPEAAKFFDRFMFEMREGRARRWMTNLYIRTYRNHFTESEIEELIKFYNTSIGKKMVEKQSVIMMQVMADARKIGSYLGTTVMEEIIKEQKQ